MRLPRRSTPEPSLSEVTSTWDLIRPWGHSKPCWHKSSRNCSLCQTINLI
ncbi:hypothetical protein FYZ48_27465 [Gimesia chilikensis]|nr:hypothetical protein FYZ48_27465 [Gimesia chilikensis]